MGLSVTRARVPAVLSDVASPAGRRVVIAVVTGLAVGSLAVAIASGPSPWLPIFIFASFSAPYLVAGAIGWLRRPGNPTGPLLLAIGLGGGLILLGDGRSAWSGVVSQVSATVATVLLFLILLVSPAGRFTSRLDAAGFVVVAVTYAVVVLVRTPVPDDAKPVLLIAICSLLLVLVLRRWHLASGPSRRSLAPIAVAGTVTTAIFLANSISIMLRIPNGPGSLVFAVDAVGRALLPFGFLVGLLRLRMARIAMADLVTELGELPAPERLRDALAAALGDPSLAVGYWSPAAGAYLAADASVVPIPADEAVRAVTRLERNGRPVAAIVHDPALGEDPGLVAAVGAAVRLTVENERLTAEVESQLEEVRASRARIVEAGDTERRRVERNLHDGAQQRLVALTLALRRARATLGEGGDDAVRTNLDAAAAEAGAALAELRELARGIHPQILTETGLSAAVDSLADRSPVGVSVEISADRYASAVESAAYFVISEGLANVAKYAHASHAIVRTSWHDQALAIEIEDDGIGGADPAIGTGLRGLADRLAALDGTLRVHSPDGGGTRLVARIPSAGPLAMPG
jgi:signal transduction histidine kinase